MRLVLSLSTAALVASGCSSLPATADAWRLSRLQAEGAVGAPGWPELWIVARDGTPEAADTPALELELTDGSLAVVPESLDVRAEVLGRVAAVEVRQRFTNPTDAPADLTLRLPLPPGAAVTDFVLEVGERVIRGVVRERAQAEGLWRAARAQGRLATLVEEGGPELVEHRVANLAPGRPVETRLAYVHGLTLEQGWCALPVPALDRAGAEARLVADLQVGHPLGPVDCDTHEVLETRLAPDRSQVQVNGDARFDEGPFVLRWRVAGPRPAAALFVEHGPRGSFALLVAHPAQGDGPLELAPASVDWGELEVADPRPARPAVLADGSLVLCARVTGGEPRGVTLRVRAADADLDLTAHVAERTVQANGPLATTWARLELARMARAALAAADDAGTLEEHADRLRAHALEHGLAWLGTAFVLVDSVN